MSWSFTRPLLDAPRRLKNFEGSQFLDLSTSMYIIYKWNNFWKERIKLLKIMIFCVKPIEVCPHFDGKENQPIRLRKNLNLKMLIHIYVFP